MRKTESAIVIDRPVEDVWPYFAMIESIPTWYPRTAGGLGPKGGTLAKASVITISRRIGPLRVESRQQVAGFEPYRLIELRSHGLLEGGGFTRLELAPVGKATRITVTSETRGLFAVIAFLGQDRDDQLLTNLKGLLEKRIAPPAVPRVEVARTEVATPTVGAPAASEELVTETDLASSEADVASSEADVASSEREVANSEVEAPAAEIPPPAPAPTNGSVGVDRRAVSADSGARLVLQLESEGGPAASFEVPRTGATLGRGEENSIRLNDLSVSRRHARISYRQGGYWISDLGSTSGTWVDGARLNAAGRLAAGQIIDVGVCRLTVAIAADAAAPRLGAAAPRRPAARARRRRERA